MQTTRFLSKVLERKKNKSSKIFNCSWLWNSLFIYYIMQIAMLGSHKDNQLCLIYTNLRVFVSRANIRAYVSRFSITLSKEKKTDYFHCTS